MSPLGAPRPVRYVTLPAIMGGSVGCLPLKDHPVHLEEKMIRANGLWYVAALLATLGMAGPLAAQESQTIASSAPLASVPLASVSFAPTIAGARLGIAPDPDNVPTTVNPEATAAASRRDGRVLAIVGGAAVIAGVLIGDTGGTIIAISGAAIGLYGLYVWQR